MPANGGKRRICLRHFVSLTRLTALLGLALTSLCTVPAVSVVAATAGAQENVTNTGSHSEAPQAVLAGGTVRVVWGERGDNAVLYSEKAVGAGWPGADRFEDGTKTAQQWPDVAVTPDGTTHIVYAGGNRIYHRSKPNGGAWSGKLLIAEDNFPNPVRLAAAPDGSLWVVWRDADGTVIRYRRSTDGGRSWNFGGDLARQSGNMFGPDIAIGPDSMPHVVWYLRQGGANENTARYADWNGSGWNLGNIGGAGGYVADPSIVVDGANAQHVVYRRQNGDNWIIQHVARGAGQSWGQQANVRTTNGDAAYPPSVAVDNSGGVHVTWSERSGGGRDIYYSARLAGQPGFMVPVNVSENSGGWNSRSTLVVSGEGANAVAHVFYQRGQRGQDVDEIFYRSISATGATPPPAPAPPAPAPAPPAPPACDQRFAETNQCVSGRLLQYWNGNGGLPVFGFPLSPEGDRQTLDGTYRMQMFERNRLELHPEKPWPYDVLLGRLGADILVQQGRPWETLPREQPRAGCLYFPETQHNICEPFLSYWRTHGVEFGDPGVSFRESLALFGLPLTGVNVESNRDGFTGQTQWFERARFEYHPDKPQPYKVLLGRLGAESGQ